MEEVSTATEGNAVSKFPKAESFLKTYRENLKFCRKHEGWHISLQDGNQENK